MIKLTRLSHTPLIVNSDLIEHIDITPDTVITLISGQKLIVRETAEEVVEKVIAFRKSIFGKELACPMSAIPKVVATLERNEWEPAHGR
jgi:flagellar protein FlbD